MNRNRPGAQPSIPWVHTAILKPAMDLFCDLGLPVEAYLARHRLPPTPWDWSRDILPYRPLLRFVDEIARNEGIPNVGQAVRDYLAFKPTDWAYAEFREPTLYSTLQTVVRRKLGSTLVHILERPRCIVFYHRILSGLPQEVEAHAGWFTLAGVIELVHKTIGRRWRDCAVLLPRSMGTPHWLLEVVADARLAPTRDTWKVVIPRSCLALEPWRGGGLPRMCLTDAAVAETMDFDGIVCRVLKVYLPSGVQRLDQVAEILDTSPRTLQRRLQAAGSSYKAVLAEARFSLARRMLEETDEKIIDIAYHAGYESPSNFTRAFRELAGVTPTRFREVNVPLFEQNLEVLEAGAAV